MRTANHARLGFGKQPGGGGSGRYIPLNPSSPKVAAAKAKRARRKMQRSVVLLNATWHARSRS